VRGLRGSREPAEAGTSGCGAERRGGSAEGLPDLEHIASDVQQQHMGRLFGVGDEGGLCTSCTARVRDSPQHFVFGCSHTDGLRHGFWQVLEEVAGIGLVTTFKGWGHRKQWLELMSWLDGDGPFEDDEFDVVLEALVDLVARLRAEGTPDVGVGAHHRA